MKMLKNGRFFNGEMAKVMASKIKISDGLPPHGDGTPHRGSAGVPKTRGGKRLEHSSFLQLLVCIGPLQSNYKSIQIIQEKKKSLKIRAKKSGLPPFLSLRLGPLAVTPELRFHRWGLNFPPFRLIKYVKTKGWKMVEIISRDPR